MYRVRCVLWADPATKFNRLADWTLTPLFDDTEKAQVLIELLQYIIDDPRLSFEVVTASG